jgi:hypothetical protein
VDVKISLYPTRIGTIPGANAITRMPPDQHMNVLSLVAADLDLNDFARRIQAIEHGRVLGDGALLPRLALTRDPGRLSLSRTAASASVLGVTEMSDPGIKYRLDKAKGFLNALLAGRPATSTTRQPVRWPGLF